MKQEDQQETEICDLLKFIYSVGCEVKYIFFFFSVQVEASAAGEDKPIYATVRKNKKKKGNSPRTWYIIYIVDY